MIVGLLFQLYRRAELRYDSLYFDGAHNCLHIDYEDDASFFTEEVEEPKQKILKQIPFYSSPDLLRLR